MQEYDKNNRIPLVSNRQVQNERVLRCAIHKAASAGRLLDLGYTELYIQAVC